VVKTEEILKIGIVLSSPPQKSETFLVTFIEILSVKHEVFLFVNKKTALFPEVRQILYLSPKRKLKLIGQLFLLVGNWKRYFSLKQLTSKKLLLHDIPIWTFKGLDYLHFSFGNLAFGREHYAAVMGCKMSVSFRGSDINVYPIRHQVNYRGILRKCTRIHSNSELLKENIAGYDDKLISKIFVINPGLQESYRTTTSQLNLILQNRQNQSQLQIISVGRLHWIKGYELILSALESLKRRGINFRYNIIGQGPEEEKLVYLSHFYGIADNVVFHGSKTGKQIRELLERSNLFVQTSWAEGFSNSTMEAQALGVPVIVTPVSGMNELLVHDKTGFICREHDAESIVEGFDWFLGLTPSQHRKVSEMASFRVQSMFSREILTDQWNLFFSE
jgi:colanic acid/amylovoran biosynthesis glycosyltransferase